MNSKTIRITAAVAAMAMTTSACQNLTAGENAALFGGLTALAVGIPLAVAGVDPRIVVPVTAGAAALAAAGAYVVAKHQATERQRKVAEQRAKLYLARVKQEEKRSTRSSSSSSSTASSSQKKASTPRYIAVETEPSAQSTGKSSAMVFDTQTNQIVGNNVYDLNSTPQAGKTMKFDTYSAQYVGTGN
jgi:hypothetical protein